MLSGSLLHDFIQPTLSRRTCRSILLGVMLFFGVSRYFRADAQTCVFNSPILASNNPFVACPAGTDTLILHSTLSVDVNYEPLFGGIPFQGVLIVDGGKIDWTSNTYLRLGYPAKVILINGGLLQPESSNAPDCTGLKSLYFDNKKTVNCNGVGAPHAFSDVNQAGCVNEFGICCNAYIVETDSSGNYNDLTLCQPGDSAHLSVIASGQLGYSYLWFPNIGPGSGIYAVTPTNNSVYTVNMSAVFDPYGPELPYVLTCEGSVSFKVNTPINLSATTTSVPCAGVPTGSVDLSVSGGTAPYTYLWSNNQTTQDLSNVTAGTYTVTVTDAKGCANIFSAIVHVTDNTPPTLSCPGNAAGVANPNACTTLIPNIDAVFSDNCPTVGVTYSLAGATTGSGSGQLSNTVPFSSGVTTATYIVDDGANTVTCNFTVTVQDTQFPTASNPAPLTGISCFANIPAPNPSVVTNEADNCGPPAVTFLSDNVVGGGGCPGDTLIVLRKYRVSDVAGNSIVVTQIIKVADNQPPTFISVPANVTVNCQSIPAVGAPAASDNCGGSVAMTYNGEIKTNGACPDSYTLTRRWTATDNCGNSLSTVQVITVQDITQPVFTSTPANITVSCDAIPGVGTPAASDNCDASATINYNGQTQAAGACPDSYTLTRRWTATDNCGNTSSTQQVITVQDITKPAFTFVPSNITVNCDAVPAVGSPAASDNCDSSVSINYDGETRTNGACADTYSLKRRWTATDNCGNSTSAEQTITVQDVTKPVFTSVPANATVNCDNVPAIGSPTASDNCAASVTINFIDETHINGACTNQYQLQRRWMATDACGNTAMATQVLTVQDVTKPVFTFVPANATVSCDAIPGVGAPTASDNCAALVSITYNGQTRIDGPCADHYTLTRRWTATDNCGNSSTTEQTITVQDLSAPVFTAVPANVTVSCDAIPPVGAPTASDNCDANVSITYNGQTRVDGACADSYILTRQWTAADNCGNTKTAQQTLTIQDVTPPVFTFIPANATVNCEAIPTLGTPLATDNCDANVTITFAGITQTSGNCASGGTVLRSWIASDNCGNTAMAQQMLTVQDTTKPAFIFVPVDVTVTCESVPAVGLPTASDNCTTTVDITYDGQVRTNGSCTDSYSLLRRWTATDVCGNTVTATQKITVEDHTHPVFTSVPADATVSCDAIPAPGAPAASDNCAASVLITYNGETRTDGACPFSYTLLRRWTATDNCGNTTTATQHLTVQDLTKPVFTFVPANVTVNCENVPAVETPKVSDNCTQVVSLTFDGETRIDGSCLDSYTLLRHWTATDNCGNIETALQTITVQDNTKPVFTFVPANVTVTCENVPSVGTPVASDNCTANLAVVYSGEIRTNGPCLNTYTLTRSWMVTDHCGNSASTAQVITVQDLTKPVFTFVPANVTVDCQNVPPVGIPSATDNCAANAIISYDGETRVDGPCPETYTLTRRWSAVDNCGNMNTAEQTIKVQDKARPMFTFVPPDVTVNCTDVPPVGTPTASDNCTANVSITYDGESRVNGSCPNTYTLFRHWTATDNCGNTESVQQTLTVRDVTAPVFTFVPENITVNCEAVPAVGNPQATDNCTAVITPVYIGEVRTDGACPNSYSLLRQWKASDECGNTSFATQQLTVQDISKPVFKAAPADVTVNCQDIPAVEKPEAIDNCSAAVIVVYNGETRTNGACPDTYVLKRSWTASDACGNSQITEQRITVQDISKPVFTFVPANITVNCEGIPPVGTPTATDNCASAVTLTYDGQTRTNGPCADTYSLLRRWTAADNCGNTVSAQQVIFVQDTTKPVFTFVPPDATVNCEAIPSIGTPVATDNCDSNVSITVSSELLTGGNCASGGMLIRRWTAMDNCGNTALVEQHLTVQDTTRPVFTFVPANLTVACSAIPTVGTPTATDNCTVNLSMTYDGQVRIDGPCPDSYTLRRSWTVKDICGNSRSAEQLITVQDLIPPVYGFVPADATVSCDAVPQVGTPTATDNCDASVQITFNGEVRIDGPCPDTYKLQRRWTATDNCGNSITAQQFVTVRDLTPPVFTFVPVSLTASCAAVPPVGTPTATDNCDGAVTITFNGETRTDGACPDSYSLRRRWTAADNCGNTTSAEQIITVQDITPPAFTNVPANTTVNCEAVPPIGAPTAIDNCTAAVTITFDGELRTDGACPDSYTLRRRWSAKDNCGNLTTAEQVITVRDVTAPTFTFTPSDAIVACDAIPQPAIPVAKDNCDGAVQIIYNGEAIISSSSATTYLLQRTWTAVDNCNNTASVVQKLSVRDTISPVIHCPANVSVDADGATCTATVTHEAPLATDNCTANPVIVSSVVNGSIFPIGITIVTMQATDESGNKSTCSFKIIVADTTAPVMSNCPANITVTTPDTGCQAVVNWSSPTVTDACDSSPITPVPSQQPGTSFPTGHTTVVYTAVDPSGNTMTCSFVVTVNETIPPVITNCPANINLLTGTCTAVANWIAPAATDNCYLESFSSNIQPGTVFQEGSTTVTYKALDAWGNSAGCSFQVTVVDTVAPKFSGCPQDTVVNSGNDCKMPVFWKMPVATDNCNPDPLIFANHMPGDDYPVGYTPVLVFVEDPSGNQDTCKFKVTVIGPPLGLTAVPDNQSFVGCSAVATWTPPIPTGDCALADLQSNYNPGDTFPIGTTIVTYTLTDTLGYSATASFTVTVTESVPPQINCPASPVQVDISGKVLNDPAKFITATDTVSTCDGVELEFDLPLASDNCGTPTVEQMAGPTTGKFFPIGDHQLEFMAKDDAGNTAQCAVQVEVLPLNPLDPQISDKIGCEGDDITLSTPVIPGATYIWTGPKGPYPNANNLLIENLHPALTGIYTVQARVHGCLTPLDSALVRQAILPDALDDLDFEVETGGTLDSIDVVLNDHFDFDDFKVTLISQLSGLTEIGNGLFRYEAGPDNGRVNFIYKLCSEACPDLCDEAVVTITIRETFCSYIPNVITPNNDGINDFLEIPCLNTELYPQNTLIIYNQWGDKVFQASPYDNDPAKAWRGTLDGKPGQDLPDGTYFYFFKPTPEKSALSGFIEIFR